MADRDDKPGEMLTISPSLERDMEKAAAGKIEAPPLEAFMSDSALQAAEDATRAAAAPVHAEDLRPISHAEAAKRTTFDGATLPSLPAPRRVIPAPFQRPSVRGGTHGKAWQPVRADQVQQGDIVPDLGLVTGVEERVLRETVAGVTEVATGTEIAVTGAGGVVRAFGPDQQVRVFRKGSPILGAWPAAAYQGQVIPSREKLSCQLWPPSRTLRSSTRFTSAWLRIRPRSPA